MIPQNRLIGIIYIEYCVILTKITGNNRYVGNVPVEASSINLSIVFDDKITINIKNTDKDDARISFSKYFSRIFIAMTYFIKF